MFEIARAQGKHAAYLVSLSRELSLARLIVRPAIREKEICGTSDVGWRPSCRPTANRQRDGAARPIKKIVVIAPFDLRQLAPILPKQIAGASIQGLHHVL